MPTSGVEPGAEQHRDLLFNTSGIVCKDFSLYGSLEDSGSKSMVSQECWIAKRRISGEKLAPAECVTGWDPSAAASAVRDSFQAYDVVLDPAQVGDMVSRKRRVMTLMGHSA